MVYAINDPCMVETFFSQGRNYIGTSASQMLALFVQFALDGMIDIKKTYYHDATPSIYYKKEKLKELWQKHRARCPPWEKIEPQIHKPKGTLGRLFRSVPFLEYENKTEESDIIELMEYMLSMGGAQIIDGQFSIHESVKKKIGASAKKKLSDSKKLMSLNWQIGRIEFSNYSTSLVLYHVEKSKPWRYVYFSGKRVVADKITDNTVTLCRTEFFKMLKARTPEWMAVTFPSAILNGCTVLRELIPDEEIKDGTVHEASTTC